MEENILEETKKESIFDSLMEYVKVIVLTIVATTVFLQFVQVSKVVGDSMLPNYQEGNILLVDKVFYNFTGLEVNDIVVVEYEHNGQEDQIIKRIIGMEGDIIEMKDNQLYRNGELIDEYYILEPMYSEKEFSYTIPEGKIFVLGDNRNISLDSRELGYFDIEEELVGRVFFRVLK